MKSAIHRVSLKHLIPDVALIMTSLYTSLLLRTDVTGAADFLPTLNKLIPIFVLLRVSSFILLGVYDILWRYISMGDALKLLRGVLVSTVLLMAATMVFDIGRLPRSIFLIDAVVCFVMLAGMRVTHRVLAERSHRLSSRKGGRRTLIYGAGRNGHTLADSIQNDLQSNLFILGFIDDDPEKLGKEMGGFRVLGSRQLLSNILRDQNVQEILVAIVDPPAELVREVISIGHPYNIRPRLISGPWKEGKRSANLDVLRLPELSDLLQRPKRIPDHSSLKDLVYGKTVLITGAGGSIGSELTRQVFNYSPARLLLLDHNEFNLYQIDHELRVAPVEDSVVVPILMDLRDRDLLQSAVRQHQPDIVLHAAAYKHVHLTEANPYSAIINNIEGTKNLLEVCEEQKVSRFVLISTDKAVNPAGIMGTTKRVCELMVHEVGVRTKRPYCAVRFGNVLGSSGSLIPLLQKQILNGEPVTITHKDMARYFMLIPEAVALVLKAATLSHPGDIMILRMGEPIRIMDIARSLITLLGKSERENPIVFTGKRPGEKLVEELYITGNEDRTSDPDVLVLPNADQIPLVGKLSLMNRIDIMLIQAHGASSECLETLSSLLRETQPPAITGPLKKVQSN